MMEHRDIDVIDVHAQIGVLFLFVDGKWDTPLALRKTEVLPPFLFIL